NFTDACATSGPFPVALNPNFLESGNASQGTNFIASAAPAGSQVSDIASNSQTTAFPTGFFAIPTGATSASFHVATSILPSVDFSAIGADTQVPVPGSGGSTFISQRLGLAWLAMTPPDPPPAQPIPTLGQIDDFPSSVTAGTSATLEVWLSAILASGGPTISLASSNP